MNRSLPKESPPRGRLWTRHAFSPLGLAVVGTAVVVAFWFGNLHMPIFWRDAVTLGACAAGAVALQRRVAARLLATQDSRAQWLTSRLVWPFAVCGATLLASAIATSAIDHALGRALERGHRSVVSPRSIHVGL